MYRMRREPPSQHHKVTQEEHLLYQKQTHIKGNQYFHRGKKQTKGKPKKQNKQTNTPIKYIFQRVSGGSHPRITRKMCFISFVGFR